MKTIFIRPEDIRCKGVLYAVLFLAVLGALMSQGCSVLSDVDRYGCLSNQNCQTALGSDTALTCLPLSKSSDKKVCDVDDDGDGIADAAQEVGASGVACLANCAGKECGDDNCGGSCGDDEGLLTGCGYKKVCQNGLCVESGGKCGYTECLPDETACNNGVCCKPNCSGKECGDDGCGGFCGGGQLEGCPYGSGTYCLNGLCTETGGQCGSSWCLPDETGCKNGKCCKPHCSGTECGSDGCEGKCGYGCNLGWTSNEKCENGLCVCAYNCD